MYCQTFGQQTPELDSQFDTLGDLFSVGSGMTYAYGVMYTFYRYDMTVDEAVELGTDYLMRSQGDIPRDEQRPWQWRCGAGLPCAQGRLDGGGGWRRRKQTALRLSLPLFEQYSVYIINELLTGLNNHHLSKKTLNLMVLISNCRILFCFPVDLLISARQQPPSSVTDTVDAVLLEAVAITGRQYNMLKAKSLLPDTQTSDPEQQFQILDTLGQGAYGCVSKAVHRRTGQFYAIKMLSATSMAELDTIKREIQILKLCDNPHIVKYYGSYFKDGNLWIVLEYCHAGSIIDLLNITQRKLNEEEIASILESILRGLVYLHENKKIHRDIKAANILLNKEGVAKLADFGVSAESMYTNAGHKSQVGSPYWMSPEVMKHNEYTNKTDVWSLGVTAIELAEGVVPNSHLKPLIAMWQLKDKPIQQFKQPQKWSTAFNNFVRDCLNVNPLLRPEAKALLQHEFILSKSKGQRLLAALVQQSLTDIEQFRLGQDQSFDSEADLMHILNDSHTKRQNHTVVEHSTNRSKQSRRDSGKPPSHDQSNNFESSVIINEDSVNASMIINDNDGSMIVTDQPKQQPNFLNHYIHGLKRNENQVELKREQMKKKVELYDQNCLTELEAVFKKYKQTINQVLVEGINDQFFGMDPAFIRSEFKSELLKTESIKDFLLSFDKYKEKTKQFQRSSRDKKEEFWQKAHRSTQTTDVLGQSDFSQFKELYPRGVKSQEFNEREFKTNEKHFFNSNSIISDIENVKYKNERYETQLNKRFIATQPHEWISVDRKPFHCDRNEMKVDKDRLKEQFLLDPDVKQSLMNHLRNVDPDQLNSLNEPNTVKFDRTAEGTIYGLESGIRHQNSVTIMRGRDLTKNHYNEQEYLLLNKQLQDEEDININLFNIKSLSSKNSKNGQPKREKKNSKTKKRTGTSNDKRSLYSKNSLTATTKIKSGLAK